MGTVFFLIFIAIIFFSALFFIILSSIFIIIWFVKKRRGQIQKKRWIVIPAIFLTISLIVALVPVGYIGFLQHVNSAVQKEIVYAQSGILLYWPEADTKGDIGSTTSWFKMDGIKYVMFRGWRSDEPFRLDYSTERREEPIANIKYDSGGFNEFMTVLLTGSTTYKREVSTIYPLLNDNGFELYEISGSAGNGHYCPENKLDSIKAYYANISNYDTQNLICEYSIYTDGEGTGTWYGTPYIRIEKKLTLSFGVFEELYGMLDFEKDLKRMDVPQKYYELAEAADPGTPLSGYDKRKLIAYSRDEMAIRDVSVAVVEGRAYAVKTSGGDYMYVYNLSDELNRYVLDNVFAD